MDYDAVLEHIGQFGRFHWYVIFLAGILQIFGGIHMKSSIFLAPMDPVKVNSQRCFVQNCDNNSTQYDESFTKFAIPKTEDEFGASSLSQCKQYKPHDRISACTAESFSNITVPCTKYVWDTSEFEETAVSEFNIVCKKSWMSTSSQSIFMAGVLLGSAGFGLIADKFGRKNVILCSSMILLSSSIGTAFAPNFKVFSVLRFITAAAVSGLFQTGYIIAVEFVGTSKRLICANLMQIIFAVGELLLGLTAYFIRKWKKLELVISIPAAVILLYYWLLPESVRWLISKGKHHRAKMTVLKAAKWNKKTIPEHLLRAAEYTNMETASENVQQSSGPLSLFKTPQLRKWTVNICFNWIVNAMVYYGLSLSASHLSGNTYLNFAVLAAVEIPAVMLATWALYYCGRRPVLCSVMVLGGISCGATIFIPQHLAWLSTTLAVLGKSAIAASFAIIYIYSAEIYPTVVRSTGIGMSSMFARLGGIIAPIINELRKVYRPLPMIIFAIASIVAGVCALALPETHDKQLPETVEETERFGISRASDILNVPRSRLLNRVGTNPLSSRSVERRLGEERQRLMTADS